jgi:hypothetical protein
MASNFEVQIIDQQFHVNSSVGPIIFLNTHNVVAQLFAPPVEICSTALIAPLSRQLPSSRPWTKEELARAEEVKQFSSRLAFESYSSIYQAIKHGTISNIPFSIRDVTNAEKILGSLVPSLKGKSVAQGINLRDAVAINKMEQKQQTLDIDMICTCVYPQSAKQ